MLAPQLYSVGQREGKQACNEQLISVSTDKFLLLTSRPRYTVRAMPEQVSRGGHISLYIFRRGGAVVGFELRSRISRVAKLRVTDALGDAIALDLRVVL